MTVWLGARKRMILPFLYAMTPCRFSGPMVVGSFAVHSTTTRVPVTHRLRRDKACSHGDGNSNNKIHSKRHYHRFGAIVCRLFSSSFDKNDDETGETVSMSQFLDKTYREQQMDLGVPIPMSQFLDRKYEEVKKSGGKWLKRLEIMDKYPAYFVDVGARFRHEGEGDKIPEKVYLQYPSTYGSTCGSTCYKVLVFFSASGTGKTVELAGSASTRLADLTLLWSREEDVKDVPGTYASMEERNKMALDIMSEICTKLKAKVPDDFLAGVLENARKRRQPLRLVLGLDEMSGLSTFVRVLIADRDSFAERVIKELFKGITENIGNIEVVFSIAGTGVSRGSIGSLPENFKSQQTSAQANARAVYEALSLKTRLTLPEWDYIQEDFPVLFSIMEHNGRMLSITISKFIEFGEEVVSNLSSTSENVIIHAVFKKFIESNGLSSFDPKYHPLVGACALAVHLFQKEIEISEDVDVENLARSLDYGLQFDCNTYKALNDGIVTVEKLVRTAGLLVPKVFPEIGTLETPFQLDSAMQLLCVAMLDSPDTEGLQTTNGLDVTSFGFEVLSTNLVKSAIAASMVVERDERMNVRDLLKEKLGFFVEEENWEMDQEGKTLTMWNQLGNVRASCITLWREEHIPTATYLQEVEATTLEHDELRGMKEIVDGEVKSINTGAGQTPVGLLLDKEVARRFDLLKKGSSGQMVDFIPPLASVADGNSPLADGYVTFWGSVGGTESSEEAAYTIMIQSKDTFGEGKAPFTKIIENGDRCYQDILKVGLGDNRLFCAASRRERLSVSHVGRPRNFIGYAVDKSKVLPDLMKRLDDRRNRLVRYKKRAFCTFQGP